MRNTHRRAISRLAAVAILILIVVAAGATVLYVDSRQGSASTSTSTSTTASSTTSTSSSTSSSSTTASAFKQSLTIEDAVWPSDGLNLLYAPDELPYPGWLTDSVYQSLVTVNESAEYGTGTIQFLPGMADNWTVSGNGEVYTFNLRQGVNFSNGDPFNSYQVWMTMYSYYYLTSNSSDWLVNYDLFNMSNVQFGPSTISAITQSGLVNPTQSVIEMMSNSSLPIYVTSPHQIVFHLASPFTYFPGIFVVYAGLVYDMQFVLQHGGLGTPVAINPYFDTSAIPGTGPYMVTQVDVNQYVQLTQSPTYWGRNLTASQIAAQPLFDPGHAKDVTVSYKADDVSRYADLSDGAAQIVAIGPTDWGLVTANPGLGYTTLPPWAGNADFLALNVNLYPTNITLVRQAISHAINLTQIYQEAFLGYMSPYVGPEYPAWKAYYDLGGFQPYQYNVTLAKQDLAEANVTVMPTLSFTIFSGCTACSNTAQLIQADLGQIGINVNIQVLQASAYYAPYGNTATNAKDASEIGQLSLINGGSAWAPGTLTPLDFWLTFVSCTSVWGNWAGYCNQTVQNAISAFTSTTNQTYIQAAVGKAQAQIYDDTPYVWIGVVTLFEPTGGSLVWDKNVVSGFLTDPVWTGETTIPIINTITFVTSS